MGDLSAERIDEFLGSRRASGCTWLITREGLMPLLELLTDPGGTAGCGGTDRRVRRSTRFSRRSPPLPAGGTRVGGYDRGCIRVPGWRFVVGCAPSGKLDEVRTSDVTRAIPGRVRLFVGQRGAELRRGPAGVSAVLRDRGTGAGGPVAAALSVSGRRSWPLPRGISRADAAALLARVIGARRRAARLRGPRHAAAAGAAAQRGGRLEAG